MSILDYGIGGNEVKRDASEAIANIPSNRTLLVEKLTVEESMFPETMEGLTTIEAVFDAFRPNVDVEFETAEGEPVQENFVFRNTGDFQVKNLTSQSPFLKKLEIQRDFYTKLVKQLRTNKILQRALKNEETKKAFIQALTQLKLELDAASKS